MPWPKGGGEGESVPPGGCPLCQGRWQTWEMMWPARPLAKNREQVAAWLAHLPSPIAVDIHAEGGLGLRILLHCPPDSASGALTAWAAMAHQQSNFVRSEEQWVFKNLPVRMLKHSSLLPNLAVRGTNSDPILALGGKLLSGLGRGQRAGLRIWVIGHEPVLQEAIRAFSSTLQSSAAGVIGDATNPWGIRLAASRLLILLGILTAAMSSGLSLSTVIPAGPGAVG